MKRRFEAADELAHDLGRDTIYCEAEAKEEDIFYQGSEDERYESATARKLRYESAGQRFLIGGSAFILTANLKGPFDSESGWENPWISRNEAWQANNGSKIRAQVQSHPQKETTESRAARRGAASKRLECHLPSPESLSNSIQADRLCMEEDDFDRVRQWRLQVKPVTEAESSASGSHSPGHPKGKRGRSSELFQKRNIKRAKTEPSQSVVTKTPNRKSRPSKTARTPCNRPALPQSSPALRQTYSFLTPSTRHSSIRTLSSLSRMKRMPKGELGGNQYETPSRAQSRRSFPSKRMPPKRDFCRGVYSRDQDSEDELSINQWSANMSSLKARNGRTSQSFSGQPEVTNYVKQIETTPIAATAAEEYDGNLTSDIVQDSAREETTWTGSDSSGKVAGGVIDGINAGSYLTGVVNIEQPRSLDTKSRRQTQLGRLRRQCTRVERINASSEEVDEPEHEPLFHEDAVSTSSLSSLHSLVTPFGSSSRQKSSDGEASSGPENDDAVSTSSLSSLHSLVTPFGSSFRQKSSDGEASSGPENDDAVSTSSLSSLQEPLSPCIEGLSAMWSEVEEVKYPDDDDAKSSSPLSELSETSSWSGISDRILQVNNCQMETPSLNSSESKQVQAPDTIIVSRYHPLSSSPSRRRTTRSSARLRHRQLGVAKPIKEHSMPLRNAYPSPLTTLTSKPSPQAWPANVDNMNSSLSSETSTRPDAHDTEPCLSGCGTSAEKRLENSAEGSCDFDFESETENNSIWPATTPQLGSEVECHPSDQPVTKPPTQGVCPDVISAGQHAARPSLATRIPFVSPIFGNNCQESDVDSSHLSGEPVQINSPPSDHCGVERSSSTQSASLATQQTSASCIPLFEKSASVKVTERAKDNEEVCTESQGVLSETNAAISTSRMSEDITATIMEPSEPDRSDRGTTGVSIIASPSRGREQAVGALRSTNSTSSKITVPVSSVIPPEGQPSKPTAPGPSLASSRQARTRVFMQSRTPEPEFSIKTFASFMSPSPNQRQPSRSTHIPLKGSDRRGILYDPGYPRERKKRVSWVSLPEDNKAKSPALRPASPPPSGPMEELPLSSKDKFKEHFYAVSHRARGSKDVQKRETDSFNQASPSYETGSDTPTKAGCKRSKDCSQSEESGQAQHQLGEASQDFLFELNDIFDEMGDVLKTWDVDNELEVARKTATVL